MVNASIYRDLHKACKDVNNNVAAITIIFVVTCNGSLAVARECFGGRSSETLRHGSLEQV